MGKITALILAAGRGVRMGVRGQLMPKGLIPVGGIPMVRQSVDMLQARGIEKIVIVTGHLREQYEALFSGEDVEFVYNDQYATTGSLHSLLVGLEHVDGDCLLAESDLIYAPQALEPMVCRSDRFLLSGPTGAGDEVYVWADRNADGRMILRDISKDSGARSDAHLGEMVGLISLSGQTVTRLRAVTQDLLRRAPAEHYEPGLVALSREVDIECILLPDLPWAEVDDEAMLEHAEQLVYPKIVAARNSATSDLATAKN